MWKAWNKLGENDMAPINVKCISMLAQLKSWKDERNNSVRAILWSRKYKKAWKD